MLITVTARLVRPHGTAEEALPDDGQLLLRPATHGVHDGALRGRETVTTTITGGVAAPVEVTPGPWTVQVIPDHGPAWESWLIELVEGMPEPVDLATLAPVAVVDGQALAKGDPGEPGKDGAPGRDGTDGAPGKDGADGADGHSPVITWDDTTVLIDGVPGPDLQGPPGAPGAGVHQDLWGWVSPSKTVTTGKMTVADGVASVHRISAAKVDWSLILSRITTGDQVGVQDQRDASVWVRWDVTGPATQDGDLWTFPVQLRDDVPQGIDPSDGRTVVAAVVKGQDSPTRAQWEALLARVEALEART